MPIDRGEMLNRYRLIEKIGEGGMGVVWRALDTSLGREVALKILPAAVCHDPQRLRHFEQEARALAALNHPNIVTIYSVEECAGERFLTMELVRGRMLDRTLPARGLPLDDLLDVAIPLASALGTAHDRGVIHRDLKPANVMRADDGTVKILDFGLAKLRAECGSPADGPTAVVTELGIVVGTPPYMSPEQIEGRPPDHRSDIFSLGVLLHEMATGERPFRGETGAAVMTAILRDEPAPVTELRPSLPPGLARVVRRCLEKEPARRYQSALDVRNDLEELRTTPRSGGVQPDRARPMAGRTRVRRRWIAGGVALALVALAGIWYASTRRQLAGAGPATGAGTSAIRAIAVLPLVNLMGDRSQDYFVDGMHDALIAELGRIPDLKVISRTSTMRYRGSTKSAPEIARELGVDALVEGSVLRIGQEVQITAQLVHGATDGHLWGETYRRDLSGALVMMADVTRAIAAQVRVTLTPQQAARMATRNVDPEAHDLYLKGVAFLSRGDTTKALEHFQQASDRDPDFARPYLGMARAYGELGNSVALASAEAFAKEKAFARKALELDGSLDEAHVRLAHALWQGDWDWSGAVQEIKQALKINPNSESAHAAYSWDLSLLNRPEEALAEARRAIEISPGQRYPYYVMGSAYYYARRYDEALAQYEIMKSLDLHRSWATPLSFGWVYAAKGMYQRALAEFLQMPDGPIKFGLLGNTHARAGNTAEARRFVRMLTARAAREHVGNYELGFVYAGLGEKDRAFESLEEAYRVRDKGLCYLKVDPNIDPLRSDPRYQDILRRMSFPISGGR